MFWKLQNRIEIKIPESWEEVGYDVFLRLFAATLIKDEGQRTLECIKAILPSEIRDEIHLISAFSLQRVYSFMEFCEPRKMGEDGRWLYDSNKLITNPNIFGRVVNGQVLSLPGKELKDMTCRAFRDAVSAYTRLQSGRQESIWAVINAVCGCKLEAKALANGLNYPVPSFIIRYFGDCLEQIYRNVALISPTFWGKTEGEAEAKGIDFGWDGIFLEVAKDQVFGTYNQVLESKFHDVMIYSIKKYEDALSQQKALEKQSHV